MNDIVCMGNEEFDNCFKVITDVDDSFVGDTLDHVGKKCLTNDGLHTYNYFIYGEDKTPDWFDISKVSHFDKMIIEEGVYIVNSFFNDNHPYAILHKVHFESWYVPLTDAHAEYGSREKIEDTYTVKRPVDSGAYLSAEDVDAAGTKVHTDNWQKGLDEYVKKSDVSDIDRAEQWFNNLHPEVFKYIMLRDLNIDEMLRIYKKEISNL